jgi:hypothetical protein
MTTTVLHANVERSRFAQHLWSAASGLLPAILGLGRSIATPPASALSAGDQAAREASHVREMAYAYARTDPGFAADLYAAAARHEAQFED